MKNLAEKTKEFSNEARIRRLIREHTHPLSEVAKENLVTNIKKNEDFKLLREELEEAVQKMERLDAMESEIYQLEKRLESFELKSFGTMQKVLTKTEAMEEIFK